MNDVFAVATETSRAPIEYRGVLRRRGVSGPIPVLRRKGQNDVGSFGMMEIPNLQVDIPNSRTLLSVLSRTRGRTSGAMA